MQGVQAWRLPVPTAASGRAQQRHAVRAKISHTGGSPGGPSRGLRAPFYRAWSTSDVVAALSPHRSRSSNSATALDGQAQTDNHEWAVQQGLSPDGLNIIDLDPLLEPHEGHLRYRYEQFLARLRDIEQFGGGLKEFAKGYEYFGFNRVDGGIVYREWAPAAAGASLIGDFNSWNSESHKMSRDKFGVWSITLPDVDGKPAIPHRSRVKVQFTKGFSGERVDRVPAYIKWAKAEEGKMGAHYDGYYWEPPESEKYKWQHPNPPKPAAPRIYEAHVGMSSTEPKVNTYRAFADDVLPRVKKAGYNTIQLMAVMEHSYYASFGYHVTNFFAVSSRSGTPEDVKYMVDKAHSMGIRVLLDIVHSHASNNINDGLNGMDFGQDASMSYFHTGDRGYHKAWDSRCFKYDNWEVQRFLLSNCRWWLDEYRFDGFRFDGVTSMLYTHHGIGRGFTGNYNEYFGFDTAVDAVVYLMLANKLIHDVRPDATVIAEDVSGMPTLCRPISEGGVGFDFRLAMAVPDHWIKLLKERKDEDWGMHELVVQLCNRRYTEPCIAYAESHDQALVGDKTTAFWLMDAEMYKGMSKLTSWPASPVIDRGMALHKVIRGITLAIGGEGWLAFMGNEFGHPEWIDFPREGNKWSYQHCRRLFDLADQDHLRYYDLGVFDRALMDLEEKYKFLSSPHQMVTSATDFDKVIVAERGDLLFVFNFHVTKDYDGYVIPCPEPGTWHCVLDSDEQRFGGQGRVGLDTDHFTDPEAPKTWVGQWEQPKRACALFVRSPPRSMQVYARAPPGPPGPAAPAAVERLPAEAVPAASLGAAAYAEESEAAALEAVRARIAGIQSAAEEINKLSQASSFARNAEQDMAEALLQQEEQQNPPRGSTDYF